MLTIDKDSQLVSVVIPTHNRAHLLPRVLESYVQPAVGEIIIVDDGSEDSTPETVSNLSGRLDIQLTYLRHEKSMGPASARNTGANAASFPLILFGEDDVLLAKDYVRILLNRRDVNKANVIAGQIMYLRPGEKPSEAIERSVTLPAGNLFRNEILELDPFVRLEKDMRVPFAHSIFLTSTEAVRQIGFDQNYQGNAYREESDFQVAMLAKGAQIFITPLANCFHLPRREVVSGGHHDRHWLIYEYWTIRNNNYFLQKHFCTLKVYFGWTRPQRQIKLDYIGYRWRERIRPMMVHRLREMSKMLVPSRVRNSIKRFWRIGVLQ